MRKARFIVAIAVGAMGVAMISLWRKSPEDTQSQRTHRSNGTHASTAEPSRSQRAGIGGSPEPRSASLQGAGAGPLEFILNEASSAAPSGGEYGPGDVERFAELRAALPGNSIIPAVRTPAELGDLAREKRELDEIHSRIYLNAASAEEIQRYFAKQQKTAGDTAELAAYLELRAPADRKAVFRSLRSAAEQMSRDFEEERRRALAGGY